ncbi:MAG: hypothetical protein O3C43_21850 [Verrucomicrobia bacterium]|nr:hypothetical protein [Verrucomicrobiota bacterium]MDA1069139.1 hypothetical protein [Verrucomicrobiota bacterium]
MKHLFFSLLIVLGLSVNSWAQFVAGTGFEDPAVVGSVYTDLIDVRTDHALADNSGEPVVNFTALGSPPTNEIGFTSFFTLTPEVQVQALGMGIQSVCPRLMLIQGAIHFLSMTQTGC